MGAPYTDQFTTDMNSTPVKPVTFVTNTPRPGDTPGSRDRSVVSAPVKSDGGSTSYYKIPEGSKDIVDLIEYKKMNFSLGNIFKAAYRLGEKEGNDQNYDLRKIIYFAERLLKQNGA